jgi:hypothetical protein
MVGRLRPPPAEKVTGGNASEGRTFTTKHGTVAKMNTAAIGKRARAPVSADELRRLKGFRGWQRRP